jgi:2-haloacid dehalogenase
VTHVGPDAPTSVIDFGSFEALTFDCYGTLIDWERGIVSAVQDLLGGAGGVLEAERVLEQYGRFEPAAERGPFRPYREVLRDVARAFGQAYGREVDERAADAFAVSVSGWPPFPDTVSALAALASRYRLAVVSNVDDDLFAGSERVLGAPFAEVVTAQQVRSYKPAPAHFHEVLHRLELPRERVLHVAQSLYHDIAPAKALGFTCVWLNRRAGRGGGGATPPSDARPDLEVRDLASLVRLAGLAPMSDLNKAQG